jgi:hypothetical protein
MEHFIEDYSESPDISFKGILAVNEALGGHVDG